MEKEIEKKTSYGILMVRVLIDTEIYVYKPLHVVKGVIDTIADAKVFIDECGSTYLTTQDPTTLSCDEDLSVCYIIDEEDLLSRYEDLSITESIDEYYSEISNCINVGVYDLVNDFINIYKLDLNPVLESIANASYQETSDEKDLLNDMLDEVNGDDMVVIGIDKFKELLKITDFHKLHGQLQSMYDEIVDINNHFDDTKMDKQVTLELFEKSFELLNINDIKVIKEAIKEIINLYQAAIEKMDDSSEYKYLLIDIVTVFKKLEEFDDIEQIKLKIVEIKETVKVLKENDVETQEENDDKKEKLLNVREMKMFFDRKVIGQEEAKIDVIQSVFNNKLVDDKRQRTSCLLIGPTGSGKTLLLETLSEYLNIPIQIIDTTQLTSPAYKGADIDEFLSLLLVKAKGDLEFAQNGIVVFDELDKKGSSDNSDVSLRGVLNTLLPFIQGTVYNVKYNGRNVVFDTSNLTVFATGAFTNVIEKVKAEESVGSTMGFQATFETKKQKCPKITLQDLNKYGYIPEELLGRFSIVTQLSEHTFDSLKAILLDSDNSALLANKKRLSKIGVELEWEDKFIDAVVNKALELKTGGRSLKAIIEYAIKYANWEVISNIGVYNKIKLLEQTVLDNENCLLYDCDGNCYNLKDIKNERIKEKVLIKK